MSKKESFYIIETLYEPIKSIYKCGPCEKPMLEGFVEEGTGRTWCSTTCLRKDFTKKEQADAYSDEGGGLYWTEWEGELRSD